MLNVVFNYYMLFVCIAFQAACLFMYKCRLCFVGAGLITSVFMFFRHCVPCLLLMRPMINVA